MEEFEKKKLQAAVKKIPCELASLTYDHKAGGSSWLGCKECARCLLEHALHTSDPIGFIDGYISEKMDDGGYELKPGLKKKESV